MHSFPAKRTFLQLSGPDAERYLNGQVSNDVRLATAEQSIHACVTDAKGKLQAVISIHRLDDTTLLIEAEADLRDDLLARLDRYLIADDCEWTDRSDELQRCHNLDGGPAPLIRAINRFGQPGYDLIGTSDELAEFTHGAADTALEELRIQNGVPAWGAELVPDMLPQEGGIEDTHISFSKGCYIGQEVISRIKSVGRVNRSLVRLQFPPGTSTDLVGKELEHEGKSVGTLTSLSSSGHALGLRHRKAAGAQSFQVSGQSGTVSG